MSELQANRGRMAESFQELESKYQQGFKVDGQTSHSRLFLIRKRFNNSLNDIPMKDLIQLDEIIANMIPGKKRGTEKKVVLPEPKTHSTTPNLQNQYDLTNAEAIDKLIEDVKKHEKKEIEMIWIRAVNNGFVVNCEDDGFYVGNDGTIVELLLTQLTRLKKTKVLS